MLEMFGKHHQSQGAEHLAAVHSAYFESLQQAVCRVLCDLLQFFQQRREKFVQHTELEREEVDSSLTAEPGATRPGQTVAANNAGRSTRSGIVSAGPTAPLARKGRPWNAQEDANLHAAAADPANRRPPRKGSAKFDTVIDWQLVGAPAAQHTLDFGHALLGEVLHVPAFSAAGDPRLAGVKSLSLRTAVVGSNGKVDLTHAIAGAEYALGFTQTTRSQLVAVRSPSSGRSYLGNVLELHCASLLGTGNGLDARGKLEVAEAVLQPFEMRCVRRNVLASRARAVTMYELLAPSGCSSSPTQAGCLQVAWDDAAALRGHVLSRLLDVNMQCKLRSIVSHLSTAASRLAPALLAIAGVDCFFYPSVSWAHGAISNRGVLNVDKWRQVTITGCGASSVHDDTR
ncbi:hypothetical protein ACK3TF_003060 [Chlorella vulgaris]